MARKSSAGSVLISARRARGGVPGSSWDNPAVINPGTSLNGPHPGTTAADDRDRHGKDREWLRTG